ncbi:MAG: hypothetical protein RL112_1932 [Planctomycetota bacterium]|jgi:regulator of sirC expression with transglutaminase-like and TPR domain
MTDPDQAPDHAGPNRQQRAKLAARAELLASLLADESEHVREAVRRELTALGKNALPALRRAAGDGDAALRGRARQILSAGERLEVLKRLAGMLSKPNLRLEPALCVLARLDDPRFDPREMLREFDDQAKAVAARARGSDSALERALALAEHLGGEVGYGGSRGEYHHPGNIHVHTAWRARQGMPLTLCAIWSSVARRAGIRTGLIPLPGHVMLRVHGGDGAVVIDPYQKGEVRSERDLRRYLRENGVPFDPAYLRDAPEPVFVRRQLANLQKSAEKRGLAGQARELQLLLSLADRRAARPAKAT